jgi:hypothetical protein
LLRPTTRPDKGSRFGCAIIPDDRAFLTFKQGSFLVTAVAFPQDEASAYGVSLVETQKMVAA